MNRGDISGVDLNLLTIFEALFEEGGASRAAIRLDMTQSAVSAALGRLRTLYADRLFVPTGRGLSPTARARELKPVISEALDRCRQSLAMASPDTAAFHGRAVSIGLSDDFELALGRPIMERVAREAPGLRVIFRQTHSQIVSEALARQDMDLAIAAGGFGARGLGREVLGQGGYACLLDGDAVPDVGLALTLDQYVSLGHLLISSGGVVGIVDEALGARFHHAFRGAAVVAQRLARRRDDSRARRRRDRARDGPAAPRVPREPAGLSRRTGLAQQRAARRRSGEGEGRDRGVFRGVLHGERASVMRQ